MKKLTSCLALVPKVRVGAATRYCCYLVGAIAIIEFILLNIFMLYVISHLSQTFSALTSNDGSHSRSFLNRLQDNGLVNDIISNAKSNQLFQKTLQETLERVYIVHSKQQRSRSGKSVLRDVKDRTMKDISFLGLDVSHSKEATYIYNRILSRKEFPYHFFIVDIGANDGFLSSNSFNFIQWGWDAVLVDPQGLELQTAWQNIKSYIDQYNDGDQYVELVRAAITEQDGSVEFHYSSRGQGTMSHVASAGVHKRLEGEVKLRVSGLTVKTLAAKSKIPKNFGILSIDAEGMGLEILKQWLALEFRPAYIIYEYLRLGEPEAVFINRLRMNGYHYLGKRGWNFIFEHQPSETESDTPS
ncbi:glycosyl transferase, group 1 [Elysia marginata]|uniref:Glycosyl transferase, group 1 n=1 Tax=Elysia marginata TaxID=1093978 RepID=A0AAV4IKG4_9GAST|nr:glycosyl transferase, group 1 [Elysia marginata]